MKATQSVTYGKAGQARTVPVCSFSVVARWARRRQVVNRVMEQVLIRSQGRR